jgi:hypothetical protein
MPLLGHLSPGGHGRAAESRIMSGVAAVPVPPWPGVACRSLRSWARSARCPVAPAGAAGGRKGQSNYAELRSAVG